MNFRKNETVIENGDLIEDAKVTANELMAEKVPTADDIFFETNLENIEKGIKKLNEYSTKCWLISSIALYTLIYDKGLYAQSGKSWEEYQLESRARLGIDNRDITEQLASARFFIAHHQALKNAGWSPIGSARKLARAELAVSLSGDLNATIQHLVHDSWRTFKDWYQSFKELPYIPQIKTDSDMSDYTFSKGTYKVKGVDAFIVNPNLPEDEQAKINNYMEKIFDALSHGYEPAIIPVYDNKEANALIRLRDKNRQSK